MSTIRVVNIQHSDATEPNIVLNADGTATFVSGITISGGTNLTVSGTAEFASGTVSAPGITFIDDNNTGIYEPAADTVAITTAATERLRIDNSGNLGIGTTSPQGLLHLAASSQPSLYFEDTGSSNTLSRIYKAGSQLTINSRHTTAGQIVFNSENSSGTVSERMRIDSSGRLLVGTSSARTDFFGSLAANVQVEGSSFAAYSCYATAGNGAFIFGRGTPISGSNLGTLTWQADDGTDEVEAASITAFVDSTPGANDMPGRLVFSTTADGASSPTERMRIDSGGNVGIGGTPSVFTGQNHLSIHSPGSSTNVAGLDFYVSGTRESGMISYPSVGENLRIFGNTARAITIANNGSERMRIDSDGRLLVNRSTTATNGALAQFSSSVGPHISVNNTGASSAFMLFQNSTSGDAAGRGLYVGNDGSAAGYLWNYESGLYFGNNGATVGQFIGTKLNVPGVYSGTTTGGGPVYVESDGDLLRYTSSLKYKTDVETVEDARADAILNCRPVWYRSKCENDIKTEGAEKSDWGWYGFIAEEVAEIEPRLVNWATKDSVEQEDKTTLSVERDPADYEAEGVRYDNFVPLMLNLIKRQKAQIETLEQRLSDAGIA